MNKANAAKFLQISERTLERYVSDGKLSPRKVAGKTNRTPDFDESELARFKAELTAMMQPVSSALAIPAPSLPVPANPPQIATEREAREEKHARLYVPIHERLTLSIDEAAALAGVSRATVLRAIANDELKVFTGVARGRRLRRCDVERWVRGWK